MNAGSINASGAHIIAPTGSNFREPIIIEEGLIYAYDSNGPKMIIKKYKREYFDE